MSCSRHRLSETGTSRLHPLNIKAFFIITEEFIYFFHILPAMKIPEEHFPPTHTCWKQNLSLILSKRGIAHKGCNLHSSSLNSAETLWDGPSQQTKPSIRCFPVLEISAVSTSLPDRVGILQGTHQACTLHPGKTSATLQAGAHGRPGDVGAQTAEEKCPQECHAGKSHCPHNNASPRGAC